LIFSYISWSEPLVVKIYDLTPEEIKIVEGGNENADRVDKNLGQSCEVQLNPRKDILRDKRSAIHSGILVNMFLCICKRQGLLPLVVYFSLPFPHMSWIKEFKEY